MHLLKLQIENWLNIKAISIDVRGDTVYLVGPNGAGKSAALDAIVSIFTGKTPDDPIRHGAERAEIIAETDEFTAKRVITNKTDRLIVTSKEGDIKKSPASFLASVIGKISFDPLAFSLFKEKEQRDVLAGLVGLDFSDIEAERQKVYDERSVVNSKGKDVIAQNKNVEAPDPQTPDEEILYKTEIEKLNQIREKHDGFLKIKGQKDGIQKQIDSNKREIEVTKQKIAGLEEQLKALGTYEADLVDQHSKIVLPPEVTEAQLREAESVLEEIEDKNVAIRAAKRYRKNIREGEKLLQEADALTQRLERLEQDKSTRTANAQFPIPGLSLSDNAVIYNGIPFSQLSKGQKIRVSCAIGMALNPEMRVLFIRDASLLDSVGKQEIIDTARNLYPERKYQLWFETTGERDKDGKCPPVGFYLEAGDIKSIDGKEVEQHADQIPE